mmetsp:Transcript_20186/g.36572  ORF Transcript_20186/g.36572 Transcript_20186/m.36572 type:complete len:243 (-) Transcript_20186:75-803(-)
MQTLQSSGSFRFLWLPRLKFQEKARYGLAAVVNHVLCHHHGATSSSRGMDTIVVSCTTSPQAWVPLEAGNAKGSIGSPSCHGLAQVHVTEQHPLSRWCRRGTATKEELPQTAQPKAAKWSHSRARSISGILNTLQWVFCKVYATTKHARMLGELETSFDNGFSTAIIGSMKKLSRAPNVGLYGLSLKIRKRLLRNDPIQLPQLQHRPVVLDMPAAHLQEVRDLKPCVTFRGNLLHTVRNAAA